MATETATVAAGCFWCIDAALRRVRGVERVESGYTGGTVPDPGYRAVCGGDTGHAEAVRVDFDPAVISYDELLDLVFDLHDPTQLNRQGNDVGTQYRSAIFPHSPAQAEAAKAAIARAQAAHDAPVVTTIEPLAAWYPAEVYHQDYVEKEGAANGYCRIVVAPKLEKFRRRYAARLKS